MQDPGRLDSVASILDFAIAREKEARELYHGYAAATDRQGLRSLLLTMSDQEGRHEQSLRELRARPSLSAMFSASPALDLRISDYTVPVSFSPDMSYQDFLLLVIQKEEKSLQLYRALESRAVEDELKFLFKGLAEEEKRHKALAQDRYDLEILTEN